GGGGEQNARVARQRAQVVELSDGPGLGIKTGIEMAHHDLLQHELEEVRLVVDGNERVDGRAELLELRRGKAAKRRERKIDKGDARVRWDCLDIGPDTPRLVTHRVRCRAAKIGELFFTDSRILREQKGAHQSVGAERI